MKAAPARRPLETVMKVYVGCSSKKKAAEFARRHPCLPDPVFLPRKGLDAELLATITSGATSPCLYIEDDVYLDAGFMERAAAGLAEIGQRDPLWGLCGNFGIALNMYGLRPTALARYLADAQGGPNLPPAILPAQSLHGNTLLINAPLLRSRGIALPERGAGSLGSLMLCLITMRNGLRNYLLPQLLVYHDGQAREARERLREARAPEFQAWARELLGCVSLSSTFGELSVREARGDMFLPEDGLASHARKPQPHVAIVIRTRFQRPYMLWRATQTAAAFRAASGHAGMYEIVIVSDRAGEKLPAGVEFRHFPTKPPLEDSRLHLIRQAARAINADYFWFLDDDDWLFPNRAAFISDSIIANPPGCTFHLGSRHFRESEVAGSFAGASRASADKTYSPRCFANSLQGFNAMPFCGLVFPAAALRNLLAANDFSRILYYEDYCIELLNMFLPGYFPVALDVLAAGISVRDNNTITEKDRTRWNTSASAAFWLTLQKANLLISRPALYQPDREEMLRGIPFAELTRLLGRKFIKKFRKMKTALFPDAAARP